MQLPHVNISLPEWVESFLNETGDTFPTLADRMALVVELSRRNIQHGTGGPFGAAVFDDTGRLIAPGINLVVTANCSVLHAEVVALMLAQKALDRFDISNGGKCRYDLFASTQPCIMCFGAVIWSGVRRLICGARGDDARHIGFDEGPRLTNWIEELNLRSIEVQTDIHRREACTVLQEYVAAGGPIYNPGPADESSKK